MKQAGKLSQPASSRGAAFLALLLLAGAEARSQLELDFKRIVENRPDVELWFTASCNGQREYAIDRRYLRVSEDGADIPDFWLCPLGGRICLSAALVFDAGGTMTGSKQAGAKAAGFAFIDLMDGFADEAAVIWFASTVTVAQQMTVYKDLLQNAVNGLPAAGARAVWDGAYTGVMSVINDGVNQGQGRAVIVLTSGADNASQRTPEEVIRLAQINHIRLFVIGLGQPAQAAVLKDMAYLTGGGYFETNNPTELSAIYEEISTSIYEGFDECLIRYKQDCPDGTERRVGLTILDFCGDSLTKTKSYTAPNDSNAFEPLRLRLGKRAALADREVEIPLELLDTITKFKPVFHKAVFAVQFDESRLQFLDVAAPEGSLLENVPIRIVPSPGQVLFETLENSIAGVGPFSALLAELVFRTRNSGGGDTAICPVVLKSCVFSAGCLTAVPEHGEVRIIADMPEIRCRIEAPNSLSVDSGGNAYVPDPFTVTQVIYNTGSVSALNPRFKLRLDTAQFSLAGPFVDSVQAGVAELRPADSTSVTWELRAKAQSADALLSLAITACFDNHPPVECGRSIYVPRMPRTSAEAPAGLSAWSFQLYPDPARGSVSVVFTGAVIDGFSAALYDAVGRLVAVVARERGAGSVPVVFDLRGLPAGVYHVSVYGGGGAKSAKFVKAP